MEAGVSWSLKGSYAETCSCDLMCPCNFSFDHGATYDYCRATLVFNIRSGEVEPRSSRRTSCDSSLITRGA